MPLTTFRPGSMESPMFLAVAPRRVHSRLLLRSLAALAPTAQVAVSVVLFLRRETLGMAGLVQPEVKLPKGQVLVVTIAFTHNTYRQVRNNVSRLAKVDCAWCKDCRGRHSACQADGVCSTLVMTSGAMLRNGNGPRCLAKSVVQI